MERRYAPYSKWLGTAFQNLSCADDLMKPIRETLNASNWHEREAVFNQLASRLGEVHNNLGLTEQVDPWPRQFWGRPFQVMDSERFATALRSASSAAQSDGLWTGRPIGGIDTFSDSTDLLSDTARRPAIANLFG